jgi:hypothetical protein
MPAKKKGPKLPFVVQPRRKPIIETLGNEESGQIEMKRLGYLTVAEKMYVQSTVTGDPSVGTIQRLASKISKHADVPIKDVLNDLTEDHEYLQPFHAEIAEALSMMASYQEKLRLVSVAALLTMRVNEDIEIDDVLGLHPDLLEAIYALYLEEEVKSVAAFEAREKEQEKVGEVKAGK